MRWLRGIGGLFFGALALALGWAAWEALQLDRHDTGKVYIFFALFSLTGALLLLRRRKASAETKTLQRPWETWKAL